MTGRAFRGLVAASVSVLLGGCFVTRDTYSEWRVAKTEMPASGPGCKNGSQVSACRRKFEVDSGRRASWGILPGGWDTWDNGARVNYATAHNWYKDYIYYIYYIPWAHLALGMPTLSSLFVVPFSPGTTKWSTYGLIGCHRYCVGGTETLVETGATEDLFIFSDDRSPGKSVVGVSENGCGKLYLGYPGHDAVKQAVATDGFVDVVEPGYACYRRFKKSAIEPELLAYEDKEFSEGSAVDRQLKHCVWIQDFCLRMEALEAHRGSEFAAADIKAQARNLAVQALAEKKRAEPSRPAVRAEFEAGLGALWNAYEDAWGAEQKRLRQVEETRIADVRRVLEGHLASSNWNEVVSISDRESAAQREGSAAEDAEIWRAYRTRAQDELEKIRAAEAERQRKLQFEAAERQRKLQFEAAARSREVERQRRLGSLVTARSLADRKAWDDLERLCRQELEMMGTSSVDEDTEPWELFLEQAEREVSLVKWKVRKPELEAELEGLESERRALESRAEEFSRGLRLLSWLRQASKQTSLQRDASFAEFKDQWVSVSGTVNDIGRALEQLWGKDTYYVSLEVDKTGWLNKTDIKFLVGERWCAEALTWDKDAKMTFRGKISSRGDLLHDITLREAEPVRETGCFFEADLAERIRLIRNELANPPDAVAREDDADAPQLWVEFKKFADARRNGPEAEDAARKHFETNFAGKAVTLTGQYRKHGRIADGGFYVSVRLGNRRVKVQIRASEKNMVIGLAEGASLTFTGSFKSYGGPLYDATLEDATIECVTR